MKLLGVIRFIPVGQDPLPAWEAAELFGDAVPDCGGAEIHREDLQYMVLFDHAGPCLRLLSEVLEAGERDGFAMAAGLAQGIRSRGPLASSMSGFTKGSIKTVFDVVDVAGTQQIAISDRLSSIISLDAPEFKKRFKRAAGQGEIIRQTLIMGTLESENA